MHVNLNSLYDKAHDVDPDLRFMALEDLKKYLSSEKEVNSKAIERFVPIIFKLLHDTNTDVQSLAVKLFAPLLKHIPANSAFQVVLKLYHEVQLENSKDSNRITTLIPSMALRLIFTTPEITFDNQVSRLILSSILPQILLDDVSLDSMEILTYLMKIFAPQLSLSELLNLSIYFVNIAFQGYGIISKRAVVALNFLLELLTFHKSPEIFVNDLVKRVFEAKLKYITGETESTGVSETTTIALEILIVILQRSAEVVQQIVSFERLTLISLSNKSAATSDTNSMAINVVNTLLSESSIDDIFAYVISVVNPTSLDEDLDASEVDFDVLFQTVSTQEEGLHALQVFIQSLPFIRFEGFLYSVLNLVRSGVKYDPLNFGDADSEQDDMFDSDIEFSDNEIEESSDNDILWKFRKLIVQVVVALSVFLDHILSVLYRELSPLLIERFNDRNEFVSDALIDALTQLVSRCPQFYLLKRRFSEASMGPAENDPKHLLSESILPSVEKEIFTNLLTDKNFDRFPLILRMVQALSVSNDGLPQDFLVKLFSCLKTYRNASGTGAIGEYLDFCSTLIETNDTNFPLDFVQFLVDDISEIIGLEQTYHNIVGECFSTAITLFKHHKGEKSLQVKLFLAAVSEKCLKKTYTAELRQRAISCLNELIYNIPIEINLVLLETLSDCLKYEATAKSTVEGLQKRVLDESCENNIAITNEPNFLLDVVKILLQFIYANDDSLHLTSLKAIVLIAKRVLLGAEDRAILFKFAFEVTNDPQLILLSLRALSYQLVDGDVYLGSIAVISEKLQHLHSLELTDLVNFVRAIAIIVDPFQLWQEISTVSNIYNRALLLLVIATDDKLENFIKEAEIQLQKKEDVLFNVEFLGNISSMKTLPTLTVHSFIELLEDASEEVRISSAKAIGKYVSQDAKSKLPSLLEYFTSSEDRRELILISLKEIVNFIADNLLKENIWNSIWDAQDKRGEEIRIGESKLAGEVLSTICKTNPDKYVSEITFKIHQMSLSFSSTYSTIVILKDLASSAGLDNVDVRKPLQLSLDFFSIMNVSIKQALMGTLLTALHNKPGILLPILNDMIIPKIYLELGAKPEFKKTIPMGPYKYNIDEGLEVRKLAYEFLSGILTLENGVYGVTPVKFNEILETIISNGLTDGENDIIIISCDSIAAYLSKHNEALNDEIFEKLVSQVQAVKAKKLKAKPSRQELESYEECQKSALKLCKTIDKLLNHVSEEPNKLVKVHISDHLVQKWNLFFNELLLASGEQ